VLPFPQGASPIALPLPRFAPLREGARARLALALADLADGRPDRAERGVREVISVGLHLVDEGPTLIDALIGTVIAREAGDDLDGLLRATGRTREADDLLRMRTQTRHVTQRMAAVTVGGGTEEALAEMPRLVTDTAGILGLRWEFYLQITSFAPCMNLHSMVFGPGEEYRTWVDQAKRSLVHRESDAQFFEFLGRGLFGTGGCIPVVEGLALARNMQ
jgi:hypothetical protein